MRKYLFNATGKNDVLTSNKIIVIAGDIPTNITSSDVNL